jgi:hypothetical protein
MTSFELRQQTVLQPSFSPSLGLTPQGWPFSIWVPSTQTEEMKFELGAHPPTIPAIAQTFETVFSQYVRHPEYKSLAPDGTPCKADTHGLLRRYPVTATEFHLIGKETERGWEQAEDISTLLRYQGNGIAGDLLRQRLLQIPLTVLERETGLSRHTILRARQGQRLQPRSRKLLQSGTLSLGC